jgi:hypothetical protein
MYKRGRENTVACGLNPQCCCCCFTASNEHRPWQGCLQRAYSRIYSHNSAPLRAPRRDEQWIVLKAHGHVQVAAKSIGVPETALLALQAIGGTAGNMICINNIISARTVVGGQAVHVSEGAFILKTAPALGIMLVVGTLISLPFLLA